MAKPLHSTRKIRTNAYSHKTPPRATIPLDMTGRAQPLTSAESRVAQLVARALRNREIAAELGLSEATVGAHLGHVYKKLGVRSRTELALRLASRKENE